MAQPLQNLTTLDTIWRRNWTKVDLLRKPNHPDKLKPHPISISPLRLVNPNEPPISRLLYGGFLEHVGRCVYGGIVDDEDEPRDEKLMIPQPGGRLSWSRDVLECMRDELEIPLYRWPGGNFVSNYHWQDGIGPIESRPARTELAWHWHDMNKFGTDEYIDWCREAKAEPYICLNMGTGTLEEALAWLEYCNGTGKTTWANMRRKNTGRDEPHKVKYWGLGNEMYGPWQLGQMSADQYAAEAKRWSHALKAVDPTIELISSGDTGVNDWDRLVVQSVVGYADQHSIHLYTMNEATMRAVAPQYAYENNVFGPAAAEHGIVVCKALCDVANCELSRNNVPTKDIKICFDEWNVWDETKAPARGHPKTDIEQRYDFVDMLGFTAWLHVLVRQHKNIAIACLAQSVNVIAPIMTTKDSLVKQTIFYPLQQFTKYMHSGYLLQVPVFRDFYDGPTFPTFIQQLSLKPTYIDTVAVFTPAADGKPAIIRVSVLNRHPTSDWEAHFRFDDFTMEKASVIEMYEDDMTKSNWFDHPETVLPTTTELKGKEWSASGGKRLVRKHSWAFFTFEGAEQ